MEPLYARIFKNYSVGDRFTALDVKGRGSSLADTMRLLRKLRADGLVDVWSTGVYVLKKTRGEAAEAELREVSRRRVSYLRYMRDQYQHLMNLSETILWEQLGAKDRVEASEARRMERVVTRLIERAGETENDLRMKRDAAAATVLLGKRKRQ